MAGLRTLRTQLGRLLVDADHLPRQFLQPGLRVERLVVKFDPVPQLSNPGRSSAARRRIRGLQERQNTAGRALGAQTNTHTQAHKRRHTYRKKKTGCVPTQPATRSKKNPIASCVAPGSIECNTSMQMSSAENPRKENRGLTLIPCSVWRARSAAVRYRDVRTPTL